MTLKLLLFTFLFIFSSISALNEDGSYTTEELYDILQHQRYNKSKPVQEIIDNEYFGEAKHLEISDKVLTDMIGTCDWKVACNAIMKCDLLPSVEFCKKVRILKGPLGKCMRKFKDKTLLSEFNYLESFLKDFTNYGLTRKCVLLIEESDTLELELEQSCGTEAMDAFEKAIPDLKEFYDC